MSKATVPVVTSVAVSHARLELIKAERARREPNGSFSPSAKTGADPDDDWGVAGQIVQSAMGHLDEAMPNGQRERATAALTALTLGVALLTRALEERGVYPDGR